MTVFQEKLRPIDKKLAYQIDKLLAAGQKPAGAEGSDGASAPTEDTLAYGPRPDQLLPRAQLGAASLAEGASDGTSTDSSLAFLECTCRHSLIAHVEAKYSNALCHTASILNPEPPDKYPLSVAFRVYTS